MVNFAPQDRALQGKSHPQGLKISKTLPKLFFSNSRYSILPLSAPDPKKGMFLLQKKVIKNPMMILKSLIEKIIKKDTYINTYINLTSCLTNLNAIKNIRFYRQNNELFGSFFMGSPNKGYWDSSCYFPNAIVKTIKKIFGLNKN